MEGSVQIEISKTREVYTTPVFCNKYQAIINVFPVLVDSRILNCIEEFSMLAVCCPVSLLIVMGSGSQMSPLDLLWQIVKKCQLVTNK